LEKPGAVFDSIYPEAQMAGAGRQMTTAAAVTGLRGRRLAPARGTWLVILVVGGVIFWRRARDGFGSFTAITLALAGFDLTFGGPPLAG
jgi:uncharacterized iron-regulated membrane protein